MKVYPIAKESYIEAEQVAVIRSGDVNVTYLKQGEMLQKGDMLVLQEGVDYHDLVSESLPDLIVDSNSNSAAGIIQGVNGNDSPTVEEKIPALSSNFYSSYLFSVSQVAAKFNAADQQEAFSNNDTDLIFDDANKIGFYQVVNSSGEKTPVILKNDYDPVSQDIVIGHVADNKPDFLDVRDVLQIEGDGVMLDLTAVNDQAITNIEVIELSGKNSSVRLSTSDVLNISHQDNVLTIDGDASAQVILQGDKLGSWEKSNDGVIKINGNEYIAYISDAANDPVLYVDANVSVVFGGG